MKLVGQLKRKYRVKNLPILHQVYVFPRGHLIGILRVAWNTAPSNDGTKVEVLAKFFSGIIQTTSQSHASVVRMHKNIGRIQGITIRIVGIKLAITGNLMVAVIVPKLVVVYDDTQGCRNDLPIVLDTNLSFRKDAELIFELRFGPGSTLVFVDRHHDFTNILVIRKLDIP